MDILFKNVLSLSYASLFIIPAAFAVRFMLKKFPKSYSYVLWLVVFARLMIPFGLPILPHDTQIYTVSQQNIFEETSQIQGNVSAEQDKGILYNVKADTSENISEKISSHTENAVTSKPHLSVELWHIWICGIIVFLSYWIVNLKNIYDKTKFAYLKNENIYYCDNISSPFVFGLVNPKIILPSDIDKQTEFLIIAHERFHIKRKDYIIKPLCLFAAVLHWFNPLVWAAMYYMTKDM